MVMIFVVNSQLPKPYAREFATASPTDRRVYLEGPIAITRGSLLSFALGLPKYPLKSSAA